MAFYNGYGQMISITPTWENIPDGLISPEKTTFMDAETKNAEVKNLYNAESTLWGYWTTDGVNLRTLSNTMYGFTDFIPIFPNQNINIKQIASGLSKNVFYYDINRNLLGTVTGYGVNPLVITDENARFIRFNDDGYTRNEVWVAFPQRTVPVLTDEQIPRDLMKKSLYLDVNKEKWRGKKIIVDGDSITDSGTKTAWHAYLKTWLDLSEVQNCAASGKTIIENRGDGRTCLERVEQDYAPDASAIFLMGAGNSGTHQPGNEDDTFADGTFYGKMNGLIDKLQSSFPLVPIALIATPPRLNQPNLYNQYEQLKTIAARKKIYFIDCFHGTLNPDNADCRTAYIPDGVHPNALGHKIIAQTILEAMKQMGLPFE